MKTCLEWSLSPFLTTTKIMRKDSKIGGGLEQFAFLMLEQRRNSEGVTEREREN